jgi:hypothetical protein
MACQFSPKRKQVIVLDLVDIALSLPDTYSLDEGVLSFSRSSLVSLRSLLLGLLLAFVPGKFPAFCVRFNLVDSYY